MVLRIPIISSYNNKGTKAAQRDLNGFSKSLKKFGLASKLSLAALTAGITKLGKDSVKAFLAEEKSAKALSTTLKNLGKSYEQVKVAEFINRTQFATGVVDDQLRPAFAKLLTATQDTAKAQDLLNLALNVSAGTGKSLEAVTTALSRAYLGNNTALSRLGVGLSKVELKAASFDQLTAKLSGLFANQASQAATTYAGKLAILGVAVDEAKEKIGTGLVGALEQANGEKGFGGLVGNINKSADAINGLIVIASKVGGVLSRLNIDLADPFNFDKTPRKAGITPFIDALAKLGAGTTRNTGTPAQQSELAIQRRQIADAKVQVGLAKKLREEAQKKTKAELQSAAAKRLASKFDQELIAIEAALKGKLSEQERARLLALKATKTESQADDLKALENLEAAQKKGAAAELARIAEIGAARAKALADQKTQSQALIDWLSANPLKIYTEVVTRAGQSVTVPGDFGAPRAASPSAPATNAVPGFNQSGSFAKDPIAPGNPITVNVQAGIIANENEIKYIIADEIVKYVRYGGTLAPAGFI